MKKIFGLLVAALLLMPSTTQAADGLKVANAVLMTAGAFDMYSTHHFLTKTPMREMNPAISWMQDSPKTMLATGAVMELTAVAVGQKLLKNHRRWAIAATFAIASVHATLAVNNTRLANQVTARNSIQIPYRR